MALQPLRFSSNKKSKKEPKKQSFNNFPSSIQDLRWMPWVPTKNTIRIGVSLAVGILLLAGLIWWTGIDKIGAAIGSASPLWLAVAALVIIPAYVLRAVPMEIAAFPRQERPSRQQHVLVHRRRFHGQHFDSHKTGRIRQSLHLRREGRNRGSLQAFRP